MRKIPNKNCLLPRGYECLCVLAGLTLVLACGYFTYTLVIDKINQDTRELHEIAVINVEPSSMGVVNTANLDLPVESTHIPKDGIPALVNPDIISAASATNLHPDTLVIGVNLNNNARAYPLALLNYHKCVNDTITGKPIAVTYCPRCDSLTVFERNIAGQTLTFKNAGLLYKNNLLLYDEQAHFKDESLWCQMMGKAIAGPKKGTKLKTVPYQRVSWQLWRQNHPGTTVLSFNTPHKDHYELKQEIATLPQSRQHPTLYPNELVIGVTAGDKTKAYPLRFMNEKNNIISDELNGGQITFNNKNNQIIVSAAPGITAIHAKWQAWQDFHPNTTVYQPGNQTRD